MDPGHNSTALINIGRSSENKEISGDVGGNSRSESGFSIEDSLAKRFQMAAAEAAKQTCSSSENEMEKPHEKFLKQIICAQPQMMGRAPAGAAFYSPFHSMWTGFSN